MRLHHQTIAWILVGLVSLWCLGFSLVPPLEEALSGTSLSSQVYQNICHQDPARSFTVFGTQWAVCHRCAAIYFSFAVVALFAVLQKRLSLASLPRPSVLVMLLLPVIIDGLADLLGVWSADLLSRLVTGGLTGTVLALVVLPVFTDAVMKLMPSLPTSSPGGSNA